MVDTITENRGEAQLAGQDAHEADAKTFAAAPDTLEKSAPQDTITPASKPSGSADAAPTADTERVTPRESLPLLKRPRKRDRGAMEGGEHEDLCRSLKRKFAVLTHDVELLSQEVARLRREADQSSATPELTPEEIALIKERHVKRLAEAQKRGTAVILRDIMAHKWAFPFNRPVDLWMYTDYLSRVSKPMDFGTIKNRMDSGKYAANTEDFTSDMRQVFENAFTYNAPGTDVHSMAMTLQDKFEERMKGLAGRLATAESERLREEEELKEVARRRLQERALDTLAVHRTRLETTFTDIDNQIREAKSEAAKGCSAMSLSEKQGLIDALAELKLEDFEFAMQLVVNRHPGLLQPNSEDMDIDLEPLDSLTLRQLSSFCRFCLLGRPSTPLASWPGLPFGSGAAGFLPVAERQIESKAPSEEALPPPQAEDGPHAPASKAADGDKVEGLQERDAEGEGPSSQIQPEQRAPNDRVLIQVRSIGERSWSILDKAAALKGHPGAAALARGQSYKEQTQDDIPATVPE